MKADYIEELGVNSKIYLSHYATLNTAIEYILKDKTLRFSSLKLTNDPRENKKKLIGAMTYGHKLSYNQEKKIEDYFHEQLQNKCKVLCLSTDTEDNKFNLRTKKSYCKPSMWAHYANNHTGVCLVFNKNLLTEEFNRKFSTLKYTFHGEVDYDDSLNKNDTKPTILENLDYSDSELLDYLIQQLNINQYKWFLRKDTDWSIENEYRYALYSDEDNYNFLPYSDSLKYIIIGDNCDESYVHTLKHLSPNTPILKLYWNASEQDYDLIEVQP